LRVARISQRTKRRLERLAARLATGIHARDRAVRVPHPVVRRCAPLLHDLVIPNVPVLDRLI
jgi:hypothetical protein